MRRYKPYRAVCRLCSHSWLPPFGNASNLGILVDPWPQPQPPQPQRIQIAKCRHGRASPESSTQDLVQSHRAIPTMSSYLVFQDTPCLSDSGSRSSEPDLEPQHRVSLSASDLPSSPSLSYSLLHVLSSLTSLHSLSPGLLIAPPRSTVHVQS